MILWQVKPNATGSYVRMLSPSSYDIDTEDLDADTYRAITTGNMIDSVVSQNWSKLQFDYKCLTLEELIPIISAINQNPIYIKALNPVLGNEYIEFKCRCSRKKFKMLETGDYSLSFNLVQKEKVAGQ